MRLLTACRRGRDVADGCSQEIMLSEVNYQMRKKVMNSAIKKNVCTDRERGVTMVIFRQNKEKQLL